MAPPTDAADVETQAPERRELEPAPHGRLVVVWPGGFASRPVPESGSLTVGRASSCDVTVSHPSVSRVHARVFGGAHAEIEDAGSANGTLLNRRKMKAGERARLAFGSVVELGDASIFVQPPSSSPTSSAGAPSTHAHADDLDSTVALVADSNINVLIVGETGTGKGVVAEAIHKASPRREREFVAINCGALAENLLEAELFGNEKGAFTGAASAKAGLVETAAGGTLFLDEVGELALATQVKLLRVIENREILRVGGRKAISVDVRFIAATHRDLQGLVRDGKLREDLYYRLNGFPITVPPLRERPGEIAKLADRFAAEQRGAGKISAETHAALLAYAWPGNIRELRNVIGRAALLARGGPILVEHLRLPVGDHAASTKGSDAISSGKLHDDLGEVERAKIVQALDQAGGNQRKAAETLGISRRTLLRRLDEYRLARPRK